jgi:Galactose oxidase, central domain/Kelch motif
VGLDLRWDTALRDFQNLMRHLTRISCVTGMNNYRLHSLGANLLSAASSLLRRMTFPLLSLGMALSLVQPCAGAPVGNTTGNLHTARYQHTATLLPDGKVLVAGGLDRPGYTGYFTTATAEVYDPKSGTWAVTGSLNNARFWHTSTLLPNGKVLVAGGNSTDNVAFASAELYDPAAGIWTPTGSLNIPRFQHTATLLPNGKVLVISGDNQNYTAFDSPELYDPATGTWTLTGPIKHSRFQHTSTLLPDGRIFIAGGSAFYSNWSPSVEIYDPVSETSTIAGDLNTGRNEHTATLLLNGKVLVAAGRDYTNGGFGGAELCDPASGTCVYTGSLIPRYQHKATLLPNGQVLVTGGLDITFNSTASAQLYDPASGTWRDTHRMNTARMHHTSTLLLNGKVLVAGGAERDTLYPSATAELYDPADGTWIAAGPFHATQAMWVFPSPSAPNPVTDPTARQTLLANAAASGVDVLYLSIYNSTQNSAGRLMYEDAAIAAFITQAHSLHMRVLAAYGAPDWPAIGNSPTDFPLSRMAEVVGYNAASATVKLDGVVLDIEPPEPQSAAAFQALLTQYQSIRAALPHDLALSIAIRFFWDTPVEFPVGSGVTKKVYEHILDMATYDFTAHFQPLQNVIVMGYRNFAGTSDCAVSGGIVCLDQDAINYVYANRATLGFYDLILAGLETSDPLTTGITAQETFFAGGQATLNRVAGDVLNRFGFFHGLGGFAIHNYGNSYLSGSGPSWPAVNSAFPFAGNGAQEIATSAGTNVTIPASAVGGAVINLTFLNVTTAGYTYVSVIDPASAGQLPGGYELAGTDLAFEITTTAHYTGPITIAFHVPGLDAVTFAQLRVFHDFGSGLVDQTASNPPPDPVTQTIYGSVTSLSPFVLAKAVDTTPPTIRSVAASPSSIWPPNKKMVSVALAVDATDPSGVASRKIVSVTSNETGSGQWQVTGDLTLNLLADRNGNGTGRTYTITVQCKDSFGNASTKTVTVRVPHDQGK